MSRSIRLFILVIGAFFSGCIKDIPIFQIDETDALCIKTYDGSNQPMHPKVLFFPNRWANKKFWMAYTPYPMSNNKYENPCISVSDDGINWESPLNHQNPLAILTSKQIQNKGHFSDTHLVFREDINRLECWYRYNINGKTEEIYRRTTLDGSNWTEPECMIDFSKPFAWCMSPAMVFEDSIYKLWAVRPPHIIYMESIDGKKWTVPLLISPSLPNNYGAWHLDVVHTDIGYEMLLNVTTGKTNENILMQSVSIDGKNWGDFSACLYPSTNRKDFDSKEIYRSTFIKVDSLYYVYYSAMSHKYSWHIGLAKGTHLSKLTKIKKSLYQRID